MNIKSWAENEVEIAKKANNDWYYELCLDSALKAYNCLMEDGHSGMSIGVTRNILNRLIDDMPLTPITEKDFEEQTANVNLPKESPKWLMEMGLKSSIQCPRMSSLFREESLGGKITYTDVDRVICYEEGKRTPFHCGTVTRFVDKLFPITLPYDGNDKYKVTVVEELLDATNGDFDTIKIISVQKNNEDPIPFAKYFHEFGGEMKEISIDNYAELKSRYQK